VRVDDHPYPAGSGVRVHVVSLTETITKERPAEQAVRAMHALCRVCWPGPVSDGAVSLCGHRVTRTSGPASEGNPVTCVVCDDLVLEHVMSHLRGPRR
jgi:hypothetical protein